MVFTSCSDLDMDVDIRSARHVSWFIRTLVTKKLFHFCRKGALCGSLSSPLEFPWPHPNSLKPPWSKQNLNRQTNNSKSFCHKQHQWGNKSMQAPTNNVYQMFHFGYGCGYQKCTHDTSWIRTIVRNKLSTPAGKGSMWIAVIPTWAPMTLSRQPQDTLEWDGTLKDCLTVLECLHI